LQKKDPLKKLEKYPVDYIVTSCPLCKKTLQKGANTKVKDIAELVMQNIKQN